jgi:single-stranded DNA-binding protein
MHNSKNTINQSDIKESTNKVILAGALDTAPSYSHDYDNVKYYTIRLKVYRNNGNKYDVLHVFIPESTLILDEVFLDVGVRVRVQGKAVQSELRGMSDVSVVAEEVQLIDSNTKDENILYIGGVIHRIFDIRPVGEDQELDLSSNQKVVKPMILKHTYAQEDGKPRSLTIKVSSWNNTAKLVDTKYDVGDKVFVRGQLESKAVKLEKSKDKKATVVLHEASAASVLSIEA